MNIGIVSSINEDTKMVRVKKPTSDVVSQEMHILNGGTGYFPKIDDMVLYTTFNNTGVILGRIVIFEKKVEVL